MDRNPSVLVTLGCYGVLLLGHGPSHIDHAVLEDYSCIAKDDIYGVIDEAFPVELCLGVNVEGVLVSVEDREFRARAKGNRLVVLRTIGVAKG